MLPILERALTDSDHPGELRLGDIDGLSELADVDSIVGEDTGGFRLPFREERPTGGVRGEIRSTNFEFRAFHRVGTMALQPTWMVLARDWI
jgi:hypothetical protein